MAKRSIFYSDPRIYKLGLLLIHGKNLSTRYEYISSQISENACVLEPGCGPALLKGYLDKSCHYKGFDLNSDFVWHCNQNSLDVYLADALDKRNYFPSDVVVLCDFVHHIGHSKEKLLIQNSLSAARHMLIICDPFKDTLLKNFPAWVPGLHFLVHKWYNHIEQDGCNSPKLQETRWKRDLEEVMMDGFDVVPRTAKRNIKEIGEDLIVTYSL
ncbi:MAG: hypothetical protein ABIF10_04210 [Candidatus Woesearchaeota archaeon]